MITANKPLELPDGLKALRRMLSGTDNPAAIFWNDASLRDRENLIFFCRPRLGKRHVGWRWVDFDFNQRKALWNGLLEMRRLCAKTTLFQPAHFNCSVFHVCTDPIPDLVGPGSEDIPSIN